jgi:hypothetical protein
VITRGRIAVALWALLIAGAFAWGEALRRSGGETQDPHPPLLAEFRLPTWQLLPAAAVAALGVALLPVAARRLGWRPLLLVSWAASLTWTVALALSDGPSALGGPFSSPAEYLAGLGAVRAAGPLRWLRTFTHDMPAYPVHVQGHPPLPTLFVWLLDAVGLTGPTWAAVVVVLAGCSSVMAIAITLRSLAGEDAARRALPFLALAPLVVWIATTMDALFLAVAAWGVSLLVVDSWRFPHRRPPSVRETPRVNVLGAGVLLGALPYLSYGLLPLLAVPAAVLLVRGAGWRALVALVVGLAVVPVLFTWGGFWWADGVTATHAAYLANGGSSRRPYGYFLVGDVAVLALLVGPAVAYVLPELFGTWRAVPALVRSGRTAEKAGTGVLAGAVLIALAVLDLSGVTRGEVERIWVPYAMWVITATALHRAPARGWLAAQAVTGLALQAFIASPW